MTLSRKTLIWFEDLGRGDVAIVGGKNASLGEMVATLSGAGIRVPPGFATTADAYRDFLRANDLGPVIDAAMADLAAGRADLRRTGAFVRAAIAGGVWPPEAEAAIRGAYRDLGARLGKTDPAVAVRSSATAEDLPDASFAGQQETFLNVVGQDALLDACRNCLASLFTDRAISYRAMKGFGAVAIALSVGVQGMVRADLGGSGVMFTLDTESGFDKLVLINAAWGLGENVVQGAVDPDEYQVFKPLLDDPLLVPIVEKTLGAKAIKMVHGAAGQGATRNVPTSPEEQARFVLSDAEIVALARAAVVIERHYAMPMDIEWARDGETAEIFIVQARPETVQSRADMGVMRSCKVTDAGPVLVEGLSVGAMAAIGPVCVLDSAADIDRFVDGAVLVTGTTDPDWAPIMKRAAAIVTDHGGRTSHAAIVSRELGLPALVGTGTATELLKDGQMVTVNCAGGERGTVHDGAAKIEIVETAINDVPATRTEVMVNMADPAAAPRWWRLPADGVGLARMEFVIANRIKAHPLALTRYDQLTDRATRGAIDTLTRAYPSREAYFIEELSMALGKIASIWHPRPAIIRMSDFKTNEYAALLGGRQFEPEEENPMLGFRGASRYCSDAYRDGFALECRAIKRLREDMGFANAVVMIPFCRTPEEADRVLEEMARNGLVRGQDGLQVYVMCEIPSNVILAEDFAKRFDGFSIGSNDLTQLTLGVDRDSEALAHLFRERDPAVLWMIETVIAKARAAGVKIGLCGQAPSNDPEFARLLVAAGIDSISVTPDSFFAVKTNVAAAEKAGLIPKI